MTNLSRVTGKVFGGNAPLDEIGQFGSAKAGTKLKTQDVATIQALPAYSSGWGSAIMTSRNFPPIEEVTGVLKTISYQNCYLLQEGVPTYDVGTNYSDTSIVKVINGTNISFYLSLTNDNIGNPLSDLTHWVKASFADRAIGEIVTSSIPLSDGGLHLLDGSELSGAGAYAQFVSYIASIYNSSLNYFCTESEWQTSVTNYGACGKFVYNSVNNTVRLPKITGFIEGTTDLSALGDLVEAGLPNITGQISGLSYDNGDSRVGMTGAFYWGTASKNGASEGGQDRYGYFDASRSSSIYGNSSTVQPQTTKVLYYIVVATSTKTDIEVDIDEIVTDLNGKADVDLSNATPAISFATAMNTAGIRTVVESYVNGTSWYRVYSDGWCEQGGYQTTNGQLTFLIPFNDDNYFGVHQTALSSGDVGASNLRFNSRTSTGAYVSAGWWMACGYIS